MRLCPCCPCLCWVSMRRALPWGCTAYGARVNNTRVPCEGFLLPLRCGAAYLLLGGCLGTSAHSLPVTH